MANLKINNDAEHVAIEDALMARQYALDRCAVRKWGKVRGKEIIDLNEEMLGRLLKVGDRLRKKRGY